MILLDMMPYLHQTLLQPNDFAWYDAILTSDSATAPFLSLEDAVFLPLVTFDTVSAATRAIVSIPFKTQPPLSPRKHNEREKGKQNTTKIVMARRVWEVT